MYNYVVYFNGYGANRVIYRQQKITLNVRHNWNQSPEEAANVMFLAQQKIKEHFTRFKITSIEQLS